ncbi:hypothetical protein BN874_2990007 [Candidatus Contendobacter odensis Run_B_J11]|uniref:Uncharacterized protein n=1 Tax=Candidatus Contendobacter odensis Run_B_J11 TaxID=1400861 RepID=A0A7U7GD42_9GAMM|nr:hypothetical protein BN874_2990007 [Candidatus Contendobacter odensis Run_B_J11]
MIKLSFSRDRELLTTEYLSSYKERLIC